MDSWVPNIAGWIARAIGRVWKGWMWPGLAAAAVWVVDVSSDALGTALFWVGGSGVTVIMDLLDGLPWPAPPSWSGTVAEGLGIVRKTGLDLAVGIWVSAGVARLVVRVVTLGRI